MDRGLPAELSMRAKLDCGEVTVVAPVWQQVVFCLSPERQRLLGSLGSKIGSLVFEDFSKCKNHHKHYMSNHLSVVAVLSSGIGPQGKISVIHMLSVVISEDRTGKRGEGKEELYLGGMSWPTGVSLPGSTSSACLHLLPCSFNDFFFLIGLMSLSLVLRAVSYFTLVPFHCSSYSNHFFYSLPGGSS